MTSTRTSARRSSRRSACSPTATPRSTRSRVMNERGSPNAWGLPDDMTFTLHGDARRGPPARRRRCSTTASTWPTPTASGAGAHFPHAIAQHPAVPRLRPRRTEFPYPIVPITVNCYGQHAIARRGGLARFADIHDERLDPAGPSPARCFDLGAAVARAIEQTGKRVALVASSSWSHAFLNDKDWHLRPDTRGRPAALRRVRARRLRRLDRGHRPARSSTPASTRCSTGSACSARCTNSGMRLSWSDLRGHRCLQLQQVLRDLRRKDRPVTATISSEATARTHRRRRYQHPLPRRGFRAAGAAPARVRARRLGLGELASHHPGAGPRLPGLAPDLVGFGYTERPRRCLLLAPDLDRPRLVVPGRAGHPARHHWWATRWAGGSGWAWRRSARTGCTGWCSWVLPASA